MHVTVRCEDPLPRARRRGRPWGRRVYAGLRSDPFFIDLPAFLGSVENDELAFRDPGENSLTNANALGLVVEVDRELLQRGGGPLFGVVSCSPASRSSDLTRSGRRTPCVPIARRTRSSRTRDAGSSCDAAAWERDAFTMALCGAIPLARALHEAAPEAEIPLFGAQDALCNLHAPNERVLLGALERAVVAEAQFFSEYAARNEAPR